MSSVAVQTILSAAVASPAGTFTVAYPTGYTQADFTGAKAATNAYMLVNDNDRFEEADDEFDISYGASLATVTWKGGYTLPINTRITLSLARVGTVDELVLLTDSSGGTASNTIADAPAAYAEATMANHLASLAGKINEIITLLKARL